MTDLNIEVDFSKRGVVEFEPHGGAQAEEIRLKTMKKWHAENSFLYGLSFLLDRYISGAIRQIKKLFAKNK